MKFLTLGPVLLLLCSAGLSQTAQNLPAARKSCDDLKAEITKKLEAKGVASYSLDIVDKDKEAPEGKVVGTCDGGAKSVVYSRTAPPQAKSPEEKKTE